MNFPKDFTWGVATASYQVEGATHLDGRGESIWDRFCRTPGKVYAGNNGDVACDQYHRYAEDVKLMSHINIGSYRFSIAWPRVMPDGVTPHRKGFDYYKRLCNTLMEHHITPAATLYHWDLPSALYDKGGWPHRDIINYFADYADLCFKELGDVVHRWFTFNEPICIAELGYAVGIHAPGHTNLGECIATIHHINVAHGRAVQCYRERHQKNEGEIGIVLNTAKARPATNRPQDVAAADILDDGSRMYLWPLVGKEYPQRRVDSLRDQGIDIPLKDGDYQQIAQPIDFLGYNYYMEFPVAHRDIRTKPPLLEYYRGEFADIFRPYAHDPRWEDTTSMGWHVAPSGLYRNLKWIQKEIGDIPIYVTENGCACADELTHDGRVHDTKRIDFLYTHIKMLERAASEGVNLKGYYLWSFIDNFEWAYGYSQRFGIVYCDYQDLARYPKDSYYFYRDLIAGYIE